MKRKRVLFPVMASSMLFLSGCWDQKELAELALISAVSLDRGEDGNYKKAVEIINPNNVSGGLQGGGGGQAPSVTVIETEGKSILDLHTKLSKEVSRLLYHPHANLLVIGEDLARKESINKLLDAFERNSETRATAYLIIAKGEPGADLIKSLSAIERLPSEKINKTLEITERVRGENLVVSLQDFIRKSSAPGIEPVVSGFTLEGDIEKGKKQESLQQSQLDTILKADGLAAFKDGKLIDWYTGDTARGVAWILDHVKQTNVFLDWEKEKDVVTYGVTRQSTSISADTSKDNLEITVKVKAEGMIQETLKPIGLDDPAVMAKLEKEAEQEIKPQLERTIKRVQEDKTDILGFGQKIYRKSPDKWKEIEGEWNDKYFPELDVKVNVDAYIRRTGLRTNTHLSDMKGKE